MQTFRFRRLSRAAVFALVAVLSGSLPLVEAQDKSVKSYTIKDTRDMRFGEILIVKESGIEVYNTMGLNDCPAKLWDALDLEKLKKEHGALKVEKNGPHHWMMD